MDIIGFLIVGGVAGWLAGMVLKGRGFGLVGNVVVGCVGALIGGLILKLFFVVINLVFTLVAAVIGAIILLMAIGYFRKRGI